MLFLKSRTNQKFLSLLIGTALLSVIVSGNIRVAATPVDAIAPVSSPVIISQSTPMSSDERQIQAVVAGELSKDAAPGAVPQIKKVYVADGYAVANWILGESGGQAVLAKKQKTWQLLAPGGGAVNASYLHVLGVPEKQAQKLVDAIKKK